MGSDITQIVIETDIVIVGEWYHTNCNKDDIVIVREWYHTNCNKDDIVIVGEWYHTNCHLDCISEFERVIK